MNALPITALVPPAIQPASTLSAFAPLPADEPIFIRPSEVHSQGNCSYAAGLRRVGVRPEYENATLLFGTSVHEAIASFLYEETSRAQLPMRFQAEFAMRTKRVVVRYSTVDDYSSLREIGTRHMELFAEWYPYAGFRPLRMRNGQPAVEVRTNVEVDPGIILSCEPDAVFEVTKTQATTDGFVIAKPGDVVIPDWKTPRSESSIAFAQRAIQPTLYKFNVEHDPKFGLDGRKVAAVGYVELIKNKVPRKGSKTKGPRIIHPYLYPRSDDQVRRALNQVRFAAWRIRNGVYFDDSKMAWNTPCDECEFAQFCLNGDTEGLILPQGMTAEQLKI